MDVQLRGSRSDGLYHNNDFKRNTVQPAHVVTSIKQSLVFNIIFSCPVIENFHELSLF